MLLRRYRQCKGGSSRGGPGYLPREARVGCSSQCIRIGACQGKDVSRSCCLKSLSSNGCIPKGLSCLACMSSEVRRPSKGTPSRELCSRPSTGAPSLTAAGDACVRGLSSSSPSSSSASMMGWVGASITESPPSSRAITAPTENRREEVRSHTITARKTDLSQNGLSQNGRTLYGLGFRV